MRSKQEIVNAILASRSAISSAPACRFAPVNIALCKYWGKRDAELNLPNTSSLSVTLAPLGTTTTISFVDRSDAVRLNGRELHLNEPFCRKLVAFLDLFRTKGAPCYLVETENNIPTAAGLASSASGFAALVKALDSLHGWNLSTIELSILARLGSGSACRSIDEGFVEWQAGNRPDGMDSHAIPLPERWPDLRLGVLTLSTREKAISSRQAMSVTAATSILYESWPKQVDRDLTLLKRAIAEKNFDLFGETAERNALAMHATMLSSWPPVFYWLSQTVETAQNIWKLRQEGLPLFFTMDAGPNIKLLFLQKNQQEIESLFKEVKVITPFN
jgi:diphosphomevalonate decarboxylase